MSLASEKPGDKEPAVCSTLKIGVETSDRAIIADCVTQCNGAANEYINEEKGKIGKPTSETWLGWTTEKLGELSGKALISWDPYVAGRIKSFVYKGFNDKYSILKKIESDSVIKWCNNMIHAEFPKAMESERTIGIRQGKACLSYFNLYKGCHDVCLEQLKKTCGITN